LFFSFLVPELNLKQLVQLNWYLIKSYVYGQSPFATRLSKEGNASKPEFVSFPAASFEGFKQSVLAAFCIPISKSSGRLFGFNCAFDFAASSPAAHPLRRPPWYIEPLAGAAPAEPDGFANAPLNEGTPEPVADDPPGAEIARLGVVPAAFDGAATDGVDEAGVEDPAAAAGAAAFTGSAAVEAGAAASAAAGAGLGAGEGAGAAAAAGAGVGTAAGAGAGVSAGAGAGVGAGGNSATGVGTTGFTSLTTSLGVSFGVSLTTSLGISFGTTLGTSLGTTTSTGLTSTTFSGGFGGTTGLGGSMGLGGTGKGSTGFVIVFLTTGRSIGFLMGSGGLIGLGSVITLTGGGLGRGGVIGKFNITTVSRTTRCTGAVCSNNQISAICRIDTANNAGRDKRAPGNWEAVV
jgi:hypothetical protein